MRAKSPKRSQALSGERATKRGEVVRAREPFNLKSVLHERTRGESNYAGRLESM
jgi:hypothetical protein